MIGQLVNRKGSEMDLLGHGLVPCPVQGRYTYMDGVNEE